MTLLVVARSIYGLENLITLNHIEKMNKIILVTGTMVGYAYIMEFFIAWYSGVEYERYTFINRASGPYCVGILDNDELQCDLSAAFLVQEAAPVRSPSCSSFRSRRTSACGSSAS